MFALELSMEKWIKNFWMTLKNVYAVIASPFKAQKTKSGNIFLKFLPTEAFD